MQVSFLQDCGEAGSTPAWDRLQSWPKEWLKAGIRQGRENGIEAWLPKSDSGCQQDRWAGGTSREEA